MSSCNRIPRDSVSFSREVHSYNIPEMQVTSDGMVRIETEGEKRFREKEESLRKKEIELMEFESRLQAEKAHFEQSQYNFENEKEIFIERFRNENEEFERKKRRDYYEMRSFMWNQAILMAEELVFQKINNKEISFKKILDGMLSKLPIAFEEVQISVHPDTVQLLDQESGKEAWIFKNIRWKYDYSLSVGEFVVEEESEYYQYKFEPMFDEIRVRINKKIEMERHYD